MIEKRLASICIQYGLSGNAIPDNEEEALRELRKGVIVLYVHGHSIELRDFFLNFSLEFSKRRAGTLVYDSAEHIFTHNKID